MAEMMRASEHAARRWAPQLASLRVSIVFVIIHPVPEMGISKLIEMIIEKLR
jgi:hypothetical protein